MRHSTDGLYVKGRWIRTKYKNKKVVLLIHRNDCFFPQEKTENITNNNTSRRSHVSDSKYGFQNTNHGNSAIITNNESVDELPLPPHPNNGSPQRSYNSPTKNGGGPPPTTTNNNNNNTPNGPTIPPKIERHKKPSKSPREAGGSLSSGVINTNKSNTHSLDRPGPNHMKMSIYDAYDPYNR